MATRPGNRVRPERPTIVSVSVNPWADTEANFALDQKHWQLGSCSASRTKDDHTAAKPEKGGPEMSAAEPHPQVPRCILQGLTAAGQVGGTSGNKNPLRATTAG
jgi:hypothetical protein